MRTYRPTKRRIYPLRTSSTQWKIPLYSKHTCNSTCKLSYITHQYDDASVMVIIDNPNYQDGKCMYSGTFNPSIIRISDFDASCSATMDGELLYDQQIVVPDTDIFIDISYPVTHSKKIKVHSPNPLGFSLAQLLSTVKEVYEKIYLYEEQTASVHKFTIERSCSCSSSILKIENNMENDANICPICLNDDDAKNTKTFCNHVFHTKCIETWIESGKETCPLCRSSLRNCNDCNGTKIIKSYYEGKVLPKEMRGSYCRNHTDGVFGIYGADIDQLYIDHMIYNRSTKLLTLDMI
uniref:RING-type domain-containing protein n=1 Tax=viral metagenome TaxID=1070528 RepID=A0A6C0KDR3_9ZZZZ